MPLAERPPGLGHQDIDTVVLASVDETLHATFVPAAGMVCCSLRHRGEELLAQRDGPRAFAERGSTMGIPLLHPWANRLAGFTYGVPPHLVELAQASPLLALDENGLPIHGVIAGRIPWELRELTAGRLRAQMCWETPELLAIFPFPHTLELDAYLQGSTLVIETTLRASSALAVPVSFGFHPYLSLPEGNRESWRIELPVTRSLLLDERMIPTGASEEVAFAPFALGHSSWDHAFGGMSRAPRFAVSAAARRVEVTFLEGYPYAQLFAPAGEDFICFEPMTAPANALISRRDLPAVGPDDEYRATFSISVIEEQ